MNNEQIISAIREKTGGDRLTEKKIKRFLQNPERNEKILWGLCEMYGIELELNPVQQSIEDEYNIRLEIDALTDKLKRLTDSTKYTSSEIWGRYGGISEAEFQKINTEKASINKKIEELKEQLRHSN